MVRRLCLAIALLAGLGACHDAAPASTPTGSAVFGDPRPLYIATDHGRVQLRVELAITEAEQRQGLMGRTSLAPDAGMAFLFDDPTTVGFWMKDTLIPLSIAFWDDQGRIVRIDEMTPCTQDACPTNRPDAPYRGAVEANAGFFADHAVTVGDTVTWGVPRV
jgi:uncharacterized membrane protein (UPF0127 family)